MLGENCTYLVKKTKSASVKYFAINTSDPRETRWLLVLVKAVGMHTLITVISRPPVDYSPVYG